MEDVTYQIRRHLKLYVDQFVTLVGKPSKEVRERATEIASKRFAQMTPGQFLEACTWQKTKDVVKLWDTNEGKTGTQVPDREAE